MYIYLDMPIMSISLLRSQASGKDIGPLTVAGPIGVRLGS
jgi:hypothetical protein